MKMLRHMMIPLGLFALISSGCGGGDNVETVSLAGNVTLDGKPLPKGTISFHPDVAGGAAVTTTIVDGKYAAGTVPVGTYHASFSSGAMAEAAPTGPVSSDFNPVKPSSKAKDPIPAKYQKPSLPVQVTETKSDLNFDLK